MTRIAELKEAIRVLIEATSSFSYDKCGCRRCKRLEQAINQGYAALRPRARGKLR